MSGSKWEEGFPRLLQKNCGKFWVEVSLFGQRSKGGAKSCLAYFSLAGFLSSAEMALCAWYTVVALVQAY